MYRSAGRISDLLPYFAGVRKAHALHTVGAFSAGTATIVLGRVP